LASVRDLYVIAAGLDHPECVNTGPGGELYAGGEIGQIYRIDPATQTASEVANAAGWIGGVCVDGKGLVYACTVAEAGSIKRIDPVTGAVETWCESADGAPLMTPNYAAFAPDGELWFTDSGYEDLDVRNGRLIRIPRGGGAGEVMSSGHELHFPNGMCFDAAGMPCFLETFTPRLSRLKDGTPEVIAEFPGNSPDGVALCADGGFLVTMYYPFRMMYVPPDGGQPTVVLDDPTGIHIPMPTNVCFYGDDLRNVAIASLGGWVVKGIDLGIAGAPLHYPEL
jgi:gluconolactonase